MGCCKARGQGQDTVRHVGDGEGWGDDEGWGDLGGKWERAEGERMSTEGEVGRDGRRSRNSGTRELREGCVSSDPRL